MCLSDDLHTKPSACVSAIEYSHNFMHFLFSINKKRRIIYARISCMLIVELKWSLFAMASSRLPFVSISSIFVMYVKRARLLFFRLAIRSLRGLFLSVHLNIVLFNASRSWWGQDQNAKLNHTFWFGYFFCGHEWVEKCREKNNGVIAIHV